MSTKNSNVRKLKTQPKQLTDHEIKRIAERLASALGRDDDNIALLMLTLDALDHARNDAPEFSNVMILIKRHLFADSAAGDQAQEQFQVNAYANRGKLLRWPNEGSAK